MFNVLWDLAIPSNSILYVSHLFQSSAHIQLNWSNFFIAFSYVLVGLHKFGLMPIKVDLFGACIPKWIKSRNIDKVISQTISECDNGLINANGLLNKLHSKMRWGRHWIGETISILIIFKRFIFYAIPSTD